MERQDLVQQWQWLDDALMKAASRLPKDRKPAEEASLRSTLATNNFMQAEALISKYRAEKGVTPEMILAYSWLGRAAFVRSF